MDSPLLPTLRNRRQSHAEEDPSLLADLSIDDYAGEEGDDSFLPSSPIKPRSGNNASSSSRSFLPSRQGASSATSTSSQFDHDDDEESTPQRPKQVGMSKPRFSLFAPPRPPSTEIPDELDQHQHAEGLEEEEEGEGGRGEGEDQTIQPGSSRPSAQSLADRDQRLRESLYELRQMNEVFEGFLGALEASRGHNERLAIRVKQTSALLDQYTALLGQAEHTQRLLANPNWTGAHDDALAIEAETQARLQAEQDRLRQAAEAAEAAQRAEEERERRIAEVERTREAGRGGRGGRGGTGTRGLGRGRGTGIPSAPIRTTPTARPGSTGIRKTTTSTAGAGTGTGTGNGGTKIGGQYGHVQSSGYGPPSRRT